MHTVRKHFFPFNQTLHPKLVKELREELGEVLTDYEEIEAYMGTTSGLPWRGAMGPSIYDVHKKVRFLTPLLCPHASTWAGPLLWMSTCGRHKIHIALLKRLVQLPSGHKTEIRLYDCNLFKTVLLVIYITNLYRRKISTFYSVQRRNSGKKYTNFFAWEEYRMTSVDSNFNFLCGRPHGLDPSLRPHASTWPWPPPPPCGCHKWMAPRQSVLLSSLHSVYPVSILF